MILVYSVHELVEHYQIKVPQSLVDMTSKELFEFSLLWHNLHNAHNVNDYFTTGVMYGKGKYNFCLFWWWFIAAVNAIFKNCIMGQTWKIIRKSYHRVWKMMHHFCNMIISVIFLFLSELLLLMYSFCVDWIKQWI